VRNNLYIYNTAKVTPAEDSKDNFKTGKKKQLNSLEICEAEGKMQEICLSNSSFKGDFLEW